VLAVQPPESTIAARRQTPAEPVKLTKYPEADRTACSTRKWKSMNSACRRVNHE